jgi:hypothetical protein
LAQQAVNDVTYNAIRIAHILMGTMITALLAMITQEWLKMKTFPLHANLKVKDLNNF